MTDDLLSPEDMRRLQMYALFEFFQHHPSIEHLPLRLQLELFEVVHGFHIPRLWLTEESQVKLDEPYV